MKAINLTPNKTILEEGLQALKTHGHSIGNFFVGLSVFVTSIGALFLLWLAVSGATTVSTEVLGYFDISSKARAGWELVIHALVVLFAVGVSMGLIWLAKNLAFMLKYSLNVVSSFNEVGVLIGFLSFGVVAFLGHNIITNGLSWAGLGDVALAVAGMALLVFTIDLFAQNKLGVIGMFAPFAIAVAAANILVGAYVDGHLSRSMSGDILTIQNAKDPVTTGLKTQIEDQRKSVQRQRDRQYRGVSSTYDIEKKELDRLNKLYTDRLIYLENSKTQKVDANARFLTVLVVSIEVFVFLVHWIIASANAYGGEKNPKSKISLGICEGGSCATPTKDTENQYVNLLNGSKKYWTGRPPSHASKLHGGTYYIKKAPNKALLPHFPEATAVAEVNQIVQELAERYPTKLHHVGGRDYVFLEELADFAGYLKR